MTVQELIDKLSQIENKQTQIALYNADLGTNDEIFEIEYQENSWLYNNEVIINLVVIK